MKRIGKSRGTALLLRQALLRSQVQTAIYELVREYEATSGFSVVRLDLLQSTKRRIVLDAIPAGSLPRSA